MGQFGDIIEWRRLAPSRQPQGLEVDDFSPLLYARPSFLEGASRILDFGSTLNEYNRALTPEQADALAIESDCQAIGEDLTRALQEGPSES